MAPAARAAQGIHGKRQQRDAHDRKAAAERAFHEGDQQDGGKGQEGGKVRKWDCLLAAAGEPVLHIDVDRPAGIADAPPDVLPHGLADLLGLSQIGLALRIPAAFVLFEVGIERGWLKCYRIAELYIAEARRPGNASQTCLVTQREDARRCRAAERSLRVM